SQIVTSVATSFNIDKKYAETMLGVVVRAVKVAYEASKVMYPPDVADLDWYNENPYVRNQIREYEAELEFLLG
ncbi:MAG: hypothetical protein NZO16_05615, partial [Deltaproteobacteria bacterium]|nr:hypothetical protein [Deltaproteobacteria bacterium]